MDVGEESQLIRANTSDSQRKKMPKLTVRYFLIAYKWQEKTAWTKAFHKSCKRGRNWSIIAEIIQFITVGKKTQQFYKHHRELIVCDLVPMQVANFF